MKHLFAWALLAKFAGKNCKNTPKEVIIDQMNEPRPLPMGKQEFDSWSDRIISGALVPGGAEDVAAFIESQRFCLANMLMHLGPTESHKPDAFFIHSLRKFAINQVADTVRKELHEAAKQRTAAEEKMNEANKGTVQEPSGAVVQQAS